MAVDPRPSCRGGGARGTRGRPSWSTLRPHHEPSTRSLRGRLPRPSPRPPFALAGLQAPRRARLTLACSGKASVGRTGEARVWRPRSRRGRGARDRGATRGPGSARGGGPDGGDGYAPEHLHPGRSRSPDRRAERSDGGRDVPGDGVHLQPEGRGAAADGRSVRALRSHREGGELRQKRQDDKRRRVRPPASGGQALESLFHCENAQGSGAWNPVDGDPTLPT